MKKLFPYGNHEISEEDIEAVVKVLKSDRLTTGPEVLKFEKALGKGFGARNVSVVSNGTAALHLAGLALGWSKGDIVLTTPMSFLATANCIVYSGATPDFVDINNHSYTLNVDYLEQKIKKYLSKGKKIKAVIGVDYAGHPCDWKELRFLADKYSFQLINDNCHALGAVYNNEKFYAAKYADIVTQSFHPVKHITTGEGGAVITNNSELHLKVSRLRTHGIVYSDSGNGPWYREMIELGYNYRLTDIQSSLGRSQYKRLNKRIARRQNIAKIYNKEFSKIQSLITPKTAKAVRHAYHLYALQILFSNLKIDKKTFFNKMLKKGIQLQVHYIPIHLNSYYMKKYDFKYGDFPNAENFYNQQLSLPIYPELKDEEIEFVIKTLINIIRS